MEPLQQDLDYASQCDLKQLQTIFSSPLDKLLLEQLKLGAKHDCIVTIAVASGFAEHVVIKRIQNIIASNILSL